MLTFPKPADLHGDVLTDELAAAGFPDAQVSVDGHELVIVGPKDRNGVQAVVDAHVPPAPGPDPDDELDAALAGVDLTTVSDAATRDALGAVIAALRGRSGRRGAAAARPT